ncbi:MAG: 2-dehydropantoate 2-reductase [Methanomicrobiales archaeon]|nr:2-dehydropantoate 2-reductase [Methanomicrobiales archaeon]MDI6875155.1 2-dehydropantoate 2-reductase [Methanomicrobiales archaeon]
MKVLVLGAGAVGLTVAAKLSKICDVHAVCREQHAALIRNEGFRMTGIWGEGRFTFSCGESAPEESKFDYVVITAKSIDTASICEQFAGLLADSEVASLQNGIGNEEIIAQYARRVIGGTIITGFEWRGTAEVRVTVEAGPIRLGRFPDGLDPAVLTLVDLFGQAGMRAEGSEHIRADIWSKTLYNCALNPIGAIAEVPYGELAHPAAWRIIEGIVREAFEVVHAEGVHLPWSDADAYLHYLRTYQLPATASHHSSMLQDIQRGRRTEIEFLNGAVAARARGRKMDAPVNAVIADLIRFKETVSARGGSKR